MARYLVRHSYVDIIGGIWMPYGAVCAMRKDLNSYDIENIKAHGDGEITRDGLDQWLTCNSGDFSSVKDFRASIEDGNTTIDIPFEHGEESEFTYQDCMYPAED